MRNRTVIFILNFLLWGSVLLNSCSVGALVNVKAEHIKYPVSHTSNFYALNDSLITEGQYTVQKEFSLSFTKWGVSSLIDIEREEDISNELNNLVRMNNGDAIVDLTVSAANSPINGLSFFTKIVSFWTALIATPLTIIEPSRDHAIIAGSAIILYVFTPAAAEIKIDGKVVKIH